jgi:hypothetical protein
MSGLVLALFAVSANAQSLPQDSYMSPRDAQMRAVTDWGYQPGRPESFPQGGQVGHTTPTAQDEPLAEPLEWKPREPIVPAPKPDEPRTRTSLDVGYQYSRYAYREPDVSPNPKIKGMKYGVTGSGTAIVYGDWFARIEGRYAWGDVDYEGSGTSNDKTDTIFEGRAVAGMDIPFGRFVTAPYAGIGYRRLYNDLRGITSTGQYGYRRTSQYLFVPIGVQQRYQFGNSSRITLGLEIDPLLHGWQFSQLSDADPSLPDVTNKQNIGYGFKGELMYEFWHFAIGPYVNYWNIDWSNPADCDANNMCWFEPLNKTLEYGVQFRAILF